MTPATPNLEALEMIAADMDYVAANVPEQFDLVTWDCGTTACAIGHHLRLHPECGLGLTNDPDAFLKFGCLRNYAALAEYLRIPFSDCGMFSADTYFIHERTPAHVAARIREFIAQHKPDRIIEVKPLERSVVHV